MSRTAIISDIHANLEAFEAVLADIERQKISEIVCLGDIVGYGPDPSACIDLVQQRCRLVIRGNHDDATIHGPMGFNELARRAIVWTRKALRPRMLRPASRQRWTFLETLPLQIEWEGFLLVHGSPRDPTSEYLMERDVILGNESVFTENFEKFETVCFVGHTHMPGVFFQESGRTAWRAQKSFGAAFKYDGLKMIINVGSVGQPRDRDPRACYLTVDSEERVFRYRRVSYDIPKTQAKIRAIEDLDSQLADRLALGI